MSTKGKGIVLGLVWMACLLGQPLYAQKDGQKPVAAEKPAVLDTAQQKGWDPISLTGVRIGVDLTEPIISYIDFDTLSYEFTMDAMLNNKFFITADYGFRGYSRGSPRMAYISNGNYFRVGVDYNILHKGTFTDAFVVGARYGMSFFEHEILYQEEDPYWFDRGLGPIRITDYKEGGLRANWYELVLGVKVKVFKDLYLFTLGKARFLSNVTGEEFLATNFIPGYGFKRGPGRLAFNIQLAYRIPLFPFRLETKERPAD